MMRYSKRGLQLTERFEGCCLEAYPDSDGIPTIGYGHRYGVRLGMSCTLEQAEAWLIEDVRAAERSVNQLVKRPLTQSEFDALVDFVFNVGDGNFEDSTMLRLLNEGDLNGAADEFDKWDHAGGNVVAGLLRRREAEKQEFQEV